VLLGVVAERGEVAYLAPNVRVTPSLLDSLTDAQVPINNRLRFASPCIEHKCIQWKGLDGAGNCGLIDHAVKVLELTSGPVELPHCGIRPTCRWFAQQGSIACGVCPEVIRRPANECRAAGDA
jgi:hypothetical protein